MKAKKGDFEKSLPFLYTYIHKYWQISLYLYLKKDSQNSRTILCNEKRSVSDSDTLYFFAFNTNKSTERSEIQSGFHPSCFL